MEKILLELLKVKLPNVDSEAVLELCNVCPDPVVAVETITGPVSYTHLTLPTKRIV